MAENEQFYLSLALRCFTGEATAEEQRALRDWRAADPQNEALYAEWQQSWALTADYEPSLQINKQHAWQRIEAQVQQDASSRARRFRVIRYWPYAAAAVLAVGLFFGLWQNQKSSSPEVEQQWLALQTSDGERRSFRLPDSSLVVLNGNSQLRYALPFDRKVQLSGEAYFEVQKQSDARFSVRTEQTEVTVLGTIFSLRSYPAEEKQELWVAEGKVRFESLQQPAQAKIFTAGQGGKWLAQSDRVLYDSSATANRVAWQTGHLVFESQALAEVLPRLEGYYDVDIEVSNTQILHCRFTADVQNPELDALLNAMAFSLDLKIEREGTTYVLVGEGCKG